MAIRRKRKRERREYVLRVPMTLDERAVLVRLADADDGAPLAEVVRRLVREADKERAA